jgi:chitodextrinase
MTTTTNRAPGRRVHRLAASVGLTLFLILVGAGGASASWTTSPVGTTASVASGTIGVKQAGFGSLAVQYSPSVTTATAPITVTNTGTIPAPYTLTLSAPAANPLAQALVNTWPVLFASNCALPVPSTGTTTSKTWAVGTTLTGSLAAGGSVVYCVSTSVTPTQVSANSAGSLVATLGLVSAVGNWSATDTATASQSVADSTAPTAPGTPVASGTTSLQTTLTWAASTDNVGVTGYEVYRGTTLVGTVTSTTFTDTGLTQGTTYSYTIKAKDAAGNGSVSGATAVATTDTAPPTAPGTPVASGTTGVATTLTWAASSDNVGVAGYEVYRGSTLVATVTSTTFTDTGLAPGTTYSYTIKAKDAAGNGSAASVATAVTTLDTTPPTVPGTPVASGTTGTQTTLTWTASTDNVGVTGYEVYRGSTLVGTVTSTTFTDAGLTQGTTYSYTIKAKDAAGNGSAASGATAVTMLDTTAPTVPGTPVASGTTGTQATLTWTGSTDNVGVTGYEVYRGSTLVGTVTSSTTTFTDTGLTAGATYSYTITAKDAAGNRATSLATSVTTVAPDTTPPSVPGTPVASATAGVQTTLTWAASTDNVAVTAYDVYRGSTLVGTVTGTTFTDTGLTPATTYSYTIKAKDAAGNGSAASGATAVTTLDTIAPSVPGTPVVSGTTDTQATLTWTASTDNVGVTGYEVYRGATLLATVTSTTYTDTGLTPGTTYSYTIQAKDAAGNRSAASTATSVITLALTSSTGYKISPLNGSGLCLDGSSNPPAIGTPVVTATCNGNSQPWKVVLITGTSYYKIVHPTKPFAWEINGSSLNDGAGAQFGADTGAANQQWEVIQQSAGQHHFVNRVSGKCLEVPGGSTATGTQLQQRTCDGSTRQFFTLN